MKCILKVKELLKKLETYDYVLVKTDAPYMPSNFPKTYTIGKDLDIMVREDDIKELRDLFEKFSEDYAEEFDIICIDEKYGFRIRYEENRKLHFQFDVKYMDANLNEDFVESMLDNREYSKEYFISDPQHEMVIRINNHAPHKQHHQTYIDKHINTLDSELITSKLNKKTIDILKEMIIND